jgi:hypothetical protein
MVSSLVIAEGEQRTPEGYESRLGPLDRFFGFPTSYVGDLLLRRGRGDGTVAIPCRRPMRADWPDVLYRNWSSRPPPSGLRWQVPGPEGVNSRPWCASAL